MLYEDLTYKLRGAIFKVYNTLGYGHKEQVYQKALAKELENQTISYKREVFVEVFYENESVGYYRPDFIIDQKVLIELKATEFMPKSYEIQMLHYLKSTKYQLGLLVNFGTPKLFIKRLVWTTNRPRDNHPRESANNP